MTQPLTPKQQIEAAKAQLKAEKKLGQSPVEWKQSWHEIGGKRCYFKSDWERKYACYLEFLKQKNEIADWQYEPQTFWFEKIKRGVRSYKPDFKVTYLNGKHKWFEVKGWMDPKSKTKLKRLKKYYPDEVIEVVDKKFFSGSRNFLSYLVPGW